jgi:hypothetical protein
VAGERTAASWAASWSSWAGVSSPLWRATTLPSASTATTKGNALSPQAAALDCSSSTRTGTFRPASRSRAEGGQFGRFWLAAVDTTDSDTNGDSLPSSSQLASTGSSR